MNPERLAAERVILVGFSPAGAEELRTSLSGHGLEVETCEDGDEALHRFQESPAVGMVIADPEGSLRSTQLCAALRALPEGAAPYLVVLTPDGGGEHRLAALRSGADDAIPASGAGDELPLKLRRMSRRRSLEWHVTHEQKLETLYRAATTLGHGINNPLQVIALGIDFLRIGASTGGESERLLHRMQAQVARIRQLVSRLQQMTDLVADPKMGEPDILDAFDEDDTYVGRLRARGRYRLLLAEDDPAQRQVARAALERSNRFDVEEASDGEEALGLALRNPPDILLADINMPRLNGFELCAAFRADAALSRVVVVMLTTRHSTADLLRCIDLGAADYLMKPVDPFTLPERLYRTMERHAAAGRSPGSEPDD